MGHTTHHQASSSDINPTNSAHSMDIALTPELRTKVNFCASQATILGTLGKLCELTAELAARGAANDKDFHDTGLYTHKSAQH